MTHIADLCMLECYHHVKLFGSGSGPIEVVPDLDPKRLSMVSADDTHSRLMYALQLSSFGVSHLIDS